MSAKPTRQRLSSCWPVLQGRQAYDLPPGEARDAVPARLPIFGAPDAVLMDLPQLTEDHVPHRPLVAGYAKPWPCTMAVWKSPAADGFALVTTFGRRARLGRLVLSGTTEIRGSSGEINGAHVSGATALRLQTMAALSAGDTVQQQGDFRATNGYFAADHTSFWGCKVG